MRGIPHADCELIVPDSIPYGGTLQRADAVIGWFTRDLWQWFADTAILRDTVEGIRHA
jgi:hypothetical protein